MLEECWVATRSLLSLNYQEKYLYHSGAILILENDKKIYSAWSTVTTFREVPDLLSREII